MNQVHIIELEIGHDEMIRQSECIKDRLHGLEQDPIPCRVGQKGGRAHGIRLPCARLTTGGRRDVVVLAEGGEDGQNERDVDGLLIHIGGEDAVECIGLEGWDSWRGVGGGLDA